MKATIPHRTAPYQNRLNQKRHKKRIKKIKREREREREREKIYASIKELFNGLNQMA